LLIDNAFGALSLVEEALTKVKTLKVKTEANEYEIWVPDAAAWTDKLHQPKKKYA
jgi:sensor histidine kinase regulating citrate/malate metabolism